jgi:hypothetical protein
MGAGLERVTKKIKTSEFYAFTSKNMGTTGNGVSPRRVPLNFGLGKHTLLE